MILGSPPQTQMLPCSYILAEAVTTTIRVGVNRLINGQTETKKAFIHSCLTGINPQEYEPSSSIVATRSVSKRLAGREEKME